MTHVDDYIDDFEKDKYVRWWLFLHRQPAYLEGAFAEFIKPYKLFCTYKGERHKVILASTLGNISISHKLDQEDHPYTGSKKVDIDDCTDFSREP